MDEDVLRSQVPEYEPDENDVAVCIGEHTHVITANAVRSQADALALLETAAALRALALRAVQEAHQTPLHAAA